MFRTGENGGRRGTMMRDKKHGETVRNKWKTTALCSLVLCVLLCGCGAGGSQVIPIGEKGGETAVDIENARESDNRSEDMQDTANAVLNLSETDVTEAESSNIKVYVCGAVANPGVVALPEGSRGEDALAAAGGFAENAWREYVNLAERVEDGQKLYFPTLDEAESGLIRPLEADDGLVNINTADVATLCTLPGIGESRARDIIAYREANGAFESCEDIMKVSGIKTSVYSKISDLIKVR